MSRIIIAMPDEKKSVTIRSFDQCKNGEPGNLLTDKKSSLWVFVDAKGNLFSNLRLGKNCCLIARWDQECSHSWLAILERCGHIPRGTMAKATRALNEENEKNARARHQMNLFNACAGLGIPLPKIPKAKRHGRK